MGLPSSADIFFASFEVVKASGSRSNLAIRNYLADPLSRKLEDKSMCFPHYTDNFVSSGFSLKKVFEI
jgi:hypothetical protein